MMKLKNIDTCTESIVLLKVFGTIKVNEKVKAHKVGNLWHVYYLYDWHSVPDQDIELIDK